MPASPEGVCLVCQARFRSLPAAAGHWQASGHRTWAIPAAWLHGRPWTLEALMSGALDPEGPGAAVTSSRR